MFRKICLLSLLVFTMFGGAAQAQDAAVHYFEINMNLGISSNPNTLHADWADVTLGVNGVSKPSILFLEHAA
ncbi:MAG: hypothetical protein ACHQAX_09985 [Gammaproteobacteria bacterium]